MKHFYLKVGLFGLLLLFCILFGVSLASSGVESIQGPMSPSKGTLSVAPTPKAAAPVVSVQAAPASSVETKIKAPQPNPVADHDNSLNRVGNKLGGLLQIVAHHGIKLFVSLFDGVLGKG